MTLPWKRFIAIGDSLTEGVGDPVRGAELRGWADRLASALRKADPNLIYANLARRGLRTEEVRRSQLQAALNAEPDLVSVLSGMNDLLDRGFKPERYRDELESMVRPLSETGALILTATFPDITVFSPLPPRLRGGVRARLHAASEMVREVSRKYDTICLDADVLPESLEREIISVDRLHPSPHGHAMLAQLFARLLGERAGVEIPAPEAAEDGGRLRQARWLIRQLDPVEIGRHIWRFYLAPRRRASS